MELNILPFVVEALGHCKKIYKDIDEVYQTNKYEFYKNAKENLLYNHQIVTEGSLIQEEYCRKILGILVAGSTDENAARHLYNLIQKGYRWTYLYAMNHKKINLQDYYNAFIKKFKTIDNPDNPIDYNFIILFFLALNNQNEIVKSDRNYNEILEMFNERTLHYNDTNKTRVSIDKATVEEREKINKLKQAIYKKYGKIENYNDVALLDNQDLEQCAFLFDIERLSSDSIFQDIKFTDKDIDNILYLYILSDKDVKDVKTATEFLITYMYILYLLKAYKQVKQMYFENNKETMYIELDGLEKSLKKTTEQLFVTKQALSKLEKTHGLLEKENERLKAELEKEKRNKRELNALREFIFNLDEREEYSVDIDIEKLKSYKAILIGGHEKWQQRMKETLSEFIFIHTDNINFDVRILESVKTVFIYTNYLNHSIYYKVMSAIEGKDIKVIYLSHQNEEKVLQEIYKSIIKE